MPPKTESQFDNNSTVLGKENKLDLSTDAAVPTSRRSKRKQKQRQRRMEKKAMSPPLSFRKDQQQQPYSDVPEQIYTDSNSDEQQAYMTSEENHPDDSDGLDTPRLSNRLTPREVSFENVVVIESPAIPTAPTGINLDPMMGSLLGVDYLPFDSRLTEDAPEGEGAIDDFESLTSDEEGGNYVSDDDDKEEEDIDLGQAIDGKKGRRKKRRALKKLRKQLSDKPKPRKDRRQRKKHWKRTKAKAKHQQLVNAVSSNIDTEIGRIDVGKKRLQTVKGSLRYAESEIRKLVGEAEKSAGKVSKLSKTITELECKLDLSLRALEQERLNMQGNMASLQSLNLSRDLLEEEAHQIEGGLRQHLNQIGIGSQEESPLNSFGESSHDTDSNHALGARSRSRSNTGGTDCSFATAYDPLALPNTPVRTRTGTIDSDGDLSFDDDTESPITTAKLPSTPVAKERTPKRSPCYFRIHDLELNSAEERVEELVSHGNRTDLCSLHHNSSHIALDALVKHAFNVVTDESSRWNPDSTSGRIISKRPTSEHNWHYAGPGDIFVWHGKMEKDGYKRDLPVIKARGMVPTTAKALLDLLLDSSKVTTYNKMSLGREDRYYIKRGVETKDEDSQLRGETKIMRSVSSVPVIRKHLELISLMHARLLEEDDDGMKGYMCVNRSIWEDEDKTPTEDGVDSPFDENYIRCECLLGVNLIRELDGGYCELTTINHFYTPGAPSFGARQFGMKAAGNFIRDIKAQFK
jgi:hypothetical protein